MTTRTTTNGRSEMKEPFYEGLELSEIRGRMPNDTADQSCWRVAPWPHGGCKSITVVMQSGHMSMVPFAKCVGNDDSVTLVNLLDIEFAVIAATGINQKES